MYTIFLNILRVGVRCLYEEGAQKAEIVNEFARKNQKMGQIMYEINIFTPLCFNTLFTLGRSVSIRPRERNKDQKMSEIIYELNIFTP